MRCASTWSARNTRTSAKTARSRRCCADSALDDPALAAIGEVVHDIDCKDEKFARPETAGVSGVLRGIADSTKGDDERLERGFRVFEDLYLFYSSRRGGREA